MDDKNFFIDLLRQLVSISSQSQNEEACSIFLTQFLRDELGVEAQLHRVEGKSFNVTATLEGKHQKNKTTLLGGHIDTVSVVDGWDTNPFELTVKGDRGYGLGAADMKGGLAAQLTVLKRIIDEGRNFTGTIELAVLCDEERHSIGANAYVKYMKHRSNGKLPDFALFAEPHYDNMVVGATGKMLLKLSVRGTAGHAANPETGVNAIDCMTAFLTAVKGKYGPLYEGGMAASHCVLHVESRYEGYSLNIPQDCVALLNKQLYVHENAEDFVSDLETIYREKVGQGVLTISREIPYYPSYELDRENQELRQLSDLLKKKYDHTPELRLNQSVSDGNILYSQLGIPTVLFGPEGHDYHKPNEYVVLSSAYRYMDMLYDFLNCEGKN